jgi:hypothetical protein
MRVLTGGATVLALALAGSTAAHAQAVFVAEPPPVYVAPYYSPAPVFVAPAYTDSIIVNPRTGRSCTIEPSGYRWCWTP